jgi:hypothetical protein
MTVLAVQPLAARVAAAEAALDQVFYQLAGVAAPGV